MDDDTNVQDDDDDNTGCGDDGCRDGNFDDNIILYSTPPPTVFEDNISNDQSCWWCGRGQRSNGSGGIGAYANFNGENGSSSSSYAYGAVAMAGTAAVLTVFFRKASIFYNFQFQCCVCIFM